MRAMFEYRPDVRSDHTNAPPQPDSEPRLTTGCTADGGGAVVTLHRDAICEIAGADRFEIQAVIASGGQGTVFQASVRATGERVALKVFHQSCLAGPRALKDEFRSLATLRHPGIVQMYELHVGDDYAFFTMELVEGSELDSYLRALSSARDGEPARGQYWGALRLLITQLAIALHAAHCAGLLHLDIKPNNVRVTELGRVVLLDFGLVRNARQRAGMQERSGGTPPYMAPEQLGAAKVSERTDWYAFGAVLAQLLDPDARMSTRPSQRQLSGLERAADAPRDLVTLCDALLQLEPEARPSGREVLARLGALTPRANANGAVPFRIVGRSEELAKLHDLFEAHRHKQWSGTTLVKLSGPAGIGKTSLLRDFLDRLLRHRAAHVFSGRCFERAMVPYRLLDELMDQLAEATRHTRAAAGVDLDQLALARMFPSFASEASRGHPNADPAPRPDELTPRAVRALVRVLRMVASDDRPLVLWLDDVHWTDLDSVPLLLALLAQHARPLILLMSGQAFDPTRPLERGIADLVQTHQHVKLVEIALSGLSVSEATALIAQHDASQATVAERIWEQAGGNPLQMAELVRHGHVAELPAAADTPASVPLDQLYIGRVAHLSLRARRLLELAALSNQPLPSQLLLEAEGGDRGEAGPLHELSRGAFMTGESAGLDLAHGTIRACIRSYLSAAQQRWAHRALAAAHHAQDPHAHELLAYHYEGAGELEACIQHLQQGAEASAQKLAFVRAAALYERAYTLLGDADPERHGRLRLQQAQSMQSATDARSAADLLAIPVPPAHGEMARSIALRTIELHLLAGHFEEAEPGLRSLLEQVGLPTFRTEQGALVRCLVELGAMVVRGLPVHPAPRPLDELARLRIEACQAALRGYSMTATFRGAVYGLILLRLACQAGEASRIVLATVHVASFLTFSNLGWAKQYARKLLARARHLAHGDRELLALAESGAGPADLFTGQWRSAYAKLRLNDAAAIYANRFGPEWILAGQMSLIALDQLGELALLRTDAQRMLESGLQQGNRMIAGETRLWCALTELASDCVDAARQQLALAEPCAPKDGFLFVHWCMLRVRAQIALYEGDYRQALLIMKRERRALRASGLLTIQFIRVMACQLEAVAITGEAMNGRLTRTQAGARLDVLAQVLARDEAAYARAAHAVMRASALVVRGRVPSAVHELQRAESLYEAADMQLHAAAMRLCSRLLLGEITEECPEQQRMHALGIVAPRRWVRWLAPCR